MALAIDHRAQLEAIAASEGAPPERISAFKTLAMRAAARVAEGRPGFGMLLDSRYGREGAVRRGCARLLAGRPVELPGSRPLEFDGFSDIGSHIAEWPVTHTVKCLCLYHPDDAEALRLQQEQSLLRLYEACRTVGRELLLEIIAGRHGRLGDQTVASVLRRLYEIGIRPDWWKLEPQPAAAAWAAIDAAITGNDPYAAASSCSAWRRRPRTSHAHSGWRRTCPW